MLATVAVGTDGSDTADIAVDAAIDLAESNRARLLILSVPRALGADERRHAEADAPDDIQWAIDPPAERVLEAAAERARERGIDVLTLTGSGNPADALCRCASDHHADVIVVGNKGIHRRVLGSVPNRVAHHAPCSVMIVKTT